MTDITGICGLNGLYNPYSYYDTEDLDPTYSSYPMFGAYGGFGGSIFGMSPMMGMMGGCDTTYFDNMKQYQQSYTDYNVNQQKMQKNADLRINAPMEAIQSTYNALKDKINKNEQGQIKDAYDNFVAAVGTAFGDGTEQEIKAHAAALYTQLSGGKTIVQDLRQTGRAPFLQGVLHALTFGLYASNSAEDNVSKITGSPVSTMDKVTQNVGRLTGAGILGAITGALTYKSKNPKTALIGLAAAGLSAIMSCITGKVTT